MAHLVSLLGVRILNNPAKFTDKYEFEITFECMEALEKDLEWKLTYVGSATSDQYDQELDSLLVGPIPVGTNKFIFEADAPNTSKIPDADILGVTVVLLTCAYDGREFVRVGYYVNNEYDSEELAADPPSRPVIERVRRNILAEKPRVTRFNIKWDNEAAAPAEFPPDQPDADLAADEEDYGAEEREEEEAEGALEAGANGEKVDGDDAAMAGVEGGEPAQAEGEEDEMSDDGSVDIEGESEDELEEEEIEGQAAGDDDAMDVDMTDKPAPTANAAVATH